MHPEYLITILLMVVITAIAIDIGYKTIRPNQWAIGPEERDRRNRTMDIYAAIVLILNGCSIVLLVLAFFGVIAPQG